MDTSASAGASGDTATTLLNEMTASVPDEPSSSSDLLILEPLAAVTWTLSMLAQSAGTAAQYFASTAADMASFSDSDSAENAISTKV